MYRAPPLRGRPVLEAKKVLLIDAKQATRDARTSVLRSHGVDVDAAHDLQAARALWKPNRYHLILIDVRRHFPGEALQFYEQIKDASPQQRFAFLVGPPVDLSLTWPSEVMVDDTSRGQWAETVRRFATAA